MVQFQKFNRRFRQVGCDRPLGFHNIHERLVSLGRHVSLVSRVSDQALTGRTRFLIERNTEGSRRYRKERLHGNEQRVPVRFLGIDSLKSAESLAERSQCLPVFRRVRR